MKQEYLFAKLGTRIGMLLGAHVRRIAQNGSIDSSRQLEYLLDRLRRWNAPPLIFRCEYLDYWSTGYVFDLVRRAAGGCAVDCQIGRIEVIGLDSGETSAVANTLRHRAESSLAAQEDKWFADMFRITAEAWQDCCPDYYLFIIRTIIGETVLDQELLASLAIQSFETFLASD